MNKVLKIPNSRQISKDTLENLHRIWSRNHDQLSKIIKETEMPFLGWHGTPAENINSLMNNPNTILNLATFYTKDTSEARLIRLYFVMSYVKIYARKKDTDGEILIFDLEKNGRNQTIEWEPLKLPSEKLFPFSLDTERYKQEVQRVEEGIDLPSRTDFYFMNDPAFRKTLTSMVIGKIQVRKQTNYKNISYLDRYAKATLIDRFEAQQYILDTINAVNLHRKRSTII